MSLAQCALMSHGTNRLQRWLVLGCTALSGVGCVSASGDNADDDDVNGTTEGALVLANPQLPLSEFDLSSFLKVFEERKKTAYQLRVTTCDETNAQSNDNVFV